MAALIILGALSFFLAIIAFRRSPAILADALRSALHRFIELAPRMVVAMLLAGFVGQLIPGELVGRSIGPESGLWGVLIASVVGGFVPSGPILAFPVVVVLLQSGAGLPQVVAFITAWSLLAFHRLVIYEMPIMGWNFAWKRVVASLPLPPIAGALTIVLMKIYYG
jgi:uncharacterized membrane protein YraQ (UPF0718 family)